MALAIAICVIIALRSAPAAETPPISQFPWFWPSSGQHSEQPRHAWPNQDTLATVAQEIELAESRPNESPCAGNSVRLPNGPQASSGSVRLPA